MKPNLTTGLDVSDRYSTYVTLASGDEAEAEGRVRTTPAALRAVFGGTQRQRVVVETGPHSPWISRLLDELGHQCIVANARMLALIHSHPRKTDRTDAESLARLGRFDPRMLAPIEHRGEEAQAHLAVLRTRDAMVRARTLLVNHARGTVKSMGGRIPSCSTRSFARMAEAHLPESLVPALEPALATIDGLTRQIGQLDRRIGELARASYPETEVLQQVAGVGPVTALAFRLVLDDKRRFTNSRSVGAYLGLVRRLDISGDSDPELRITKAGNGLLRRLLVQAAHYILGPFGPDTALRRWGLDYIRSSGGTGRAKKKATVAVARRLAVLLHRLWVTGEVYEPLRGAADDNARKEARTTDR